MSILNVVPDVMNAAAGNLAEIGSAMSAANAAAAPPTTGLVAMAADQVSAAVTTVFATHAQDYQALSAKMAAFHDQFVRTLSNGAGAYLGAEIANAEQNLLNAVNGPALSLLGHPLLGTGADSAARAATAGSGTSATATGATATGATATSATATGATATGATATGATATGATATGATTTGATATGATATGATVTGATGGGAMLPLAGPTAPVSVPLLNTSTPLGPVALTLNGTVDLTTFEVALTSGSIALPTPLALGIDALGPYYLATTALQNSAIAFGNAISSGNPLAAAGTLFFAPVNAVNSFLFGHDTITQSMAAPAGLGYSDVAFSVPVGGLLSPLQPFTLTLTPTSGTPTSIALGGTQVGGLVPGLLGLLSG
ncbi:putative PE family protein PE23 [Mycobacterium persicum]|uniref:PE family protein PE23 n=2 Tax=Mycobacterium persicum TaxID=1487726 RepID=A0ABY6RHY7_9MYCO|nr:putative PE family protein PE23 [Mycobacterium persicum]VAZ93349.1 putative PE family protein PE23 [Mycobacterium persicum]